MFPSLGGYGGHWGQQQVRGDMHSSPAPPAPQGAHHGPWPLARGVRAQGTPNSPQLGRWSANFLWVAARRLARGSCREAAPETPWGRKGEEDAAAGGSDGRRGTPELRRDQQRLKFLLSRCLFSGSIACGFPPLALRLPVSSPSSPTREYLKGPRGTFRAPL